jgi:hypothetical protein
MDDAQFDRLIGKASDAGLIPGIYNYCDRRCDRCRFSDRCLDYIESREERSHASRDPSSSVAARVGRSIGRALDMMRIIAEREGIDLSLTPEDRVAFEQAHQEQVDRTTRDPLVALGKQYATTTWPIVHALWPIVMARGDEVVIAAVESIEQLCGSVASKIYRAVSTTNEPDFDASALQGDANGSAKIARLMIAESRGAWQRLMETGRAAADGVPARLVDMLTTIDAGLAARFPRAMEFVRPGFDTEPPGTGKEGDSEAAMAATMPQGHA